MLPVAINIFKKNAPIYIGYASITIISIFALCHGLLHHSDNHVYLGVAGLSMGTIFLLSTMIYHYVIF